MLHLFIIFVVQQLDNSYCGAADVLCGYMLSGIEILLFIF